MSLGNMMATTASTSNYFDVYKVQHHIAIPDPDMPQPRYHTVIFVQTSPFKFGFTHHVTGDLVTGMTYSSRPDPPPETSSTFHSKEFLGRVEQHRYWSELGEVCAGLPSVQKQKRYNPKTNRTEPVKSDGEFYQQGEPRARLVKCTEWVVESAIPALVAAGLIV